MDAAFKTALQRDGVIPAANQPQIALLIAIPFAEEIPRRNDGQQQQEHNT